jgi:LacI family transcriptional regulator, gluconate utilization system Gnt-I transcriptional repressor
MSNKARASRVTLNDVALRAGVSPVTVSRVLRAPEKVSELLRTRVHAAVRELAYIPNQLASALASSRTGRVAVIVPSLTNGVFDDYLRAAHDMFVPAGIEVLVLNSNYAPGHEERAIATALGQFPEAIILAGIDQTAQASKSLLRAGIPVVQTMEISPDPIDINIGLSHFDAGYAAARHLFDLGHRNVGHIASPLDSRGHKRVAGYLQAVREFGATPAIATGDGPSSVGLGGSLLVKLLEGAPALSAVFCGSDNLALGALFECQRRRIRVPGDLSIIGFHDLEFAASAYPSLSTVATPRYKMAQRAAEIILEIVRGSQKRPEMRQFDLGFKVVKRESTAEPICARS